MGRHVIIKEFLLNEDGTHTCSLCNKVINHSRKKITESRFSCPHCGNYRGISDNLIKLYKDSKWLDDSKYLIHNSGVILSTSGKLSVLKCNIDKRGYSKFTLNNKHHKVHRLVARYFISEAPSHMHQVHHKNSIRHDNRVENLEWVLPKRNIEYIEVDNKLRVSIIRKVADHLTIEEMSTLTGFTEETLTYILKTPEA